MINQLGKVIKYRSQHDFDYDVIIIERDYVLSYWRGASIGPIDYQLKLFCRNLLDDVWKYYPRFFEWVDRKVVPGILNGSREIVILLREGDLLGYSILKMTPKEKKICTLYVKPNHRKYGVGSTLLNVSKVRLNENRPLITVGEDRVEEFYSIFEKNGFELVDNIENLYQDGKKEYVFNRELIFNEGSIINKA